MEFGSQHIWMKEDPLDELRAERGALVAAGRTFIDLSMINSDLPPPRLLLDRLMEASAKSDNHRYAVSRGVRKLREGFATKYRNRFGVNLDPEGEVCVTMGTKDALSNALQVLCAPGDGVLLGMPTYPAHLSAVRLARLTPSFFLLQQNEEAMLQDIVQSLRKGTIKLVLLNFPNNPTGISVSMQFYKELLKLTSAEGVFVINDFAYGEMSFSGNPPSILAASTTRVLVAETYSLSKGYNVPGWRVGALLGSHEAIRNVARLKAFIDYGLFLPIQYAAAAALGATEDLTGPTVRTYQQRLRLVVKQLVERGYQVEMPSAGASLWIQIQGSQTAKDYTLRLLREQGIILMPGELFGREFSNHVRLAVVGSEERLRDVVARM